MKKLRWELKEGYIEAVISPRTIITIEPRPAYCDRGHWVAKLETNEWHIDGADYWPRYYFDLERAKLECEAFADKRSLERHVQEEGYAR